MISVIVPIYNVEKYLRDCIDSILRQTYRDLEIILVDDGSTDRSGEICDEYAAADSRIIVIHKENGGLSDARNVGMSAAHGEYYYFLDSDDYIKDDALEQLLQFAEKERSEIVSFNHITFSDDPDFDCRIEKLIQYPQGSGTRNILLRFKKEDGWFPAAPFQFYKADFVKREGLHFKKGIYFEDLLFNGIAYVRAGKVSPINKRLYYYRLRKGSIMNSQASLKKLLSYQTCIKGFIKEKKHYPCGSEQEKALDTLICFAALKILEDYALLSKEEQIKYSTDRKKVIRYLRSVNNIDCRKTIFKLTYPQIWLILRKLKYAVKKRDTSLDLK